MKFVVPLTIPRIRWTVVTTSASLRTLITGMAAQTLASKLDACCRSRSEELGSSTRDELLVCRHHRLAGAEQGENVVAGRLDSSHDLRDDGDRRIVADVRDVGGEDSRIGGKSTFLVRIPDEGPDEAVAVTRRAIDVVRALDEEAADRRADGAVAEKSYWDVNGRHELPAPPSA